MTIDKTIMEAKYSADLKGYPVDGFLINKLDLDILVDKFVKDVDIPKILSDFRYMGYKLYPTTELKRGLIKIILKT